MPNPRPVNLTAANHGSDSTPLYSPDGKYLAIRSQFRAGYESDRFRLQLIERATGKITNLTENFDRWVESVAWAPDSSKLYFTSEDAGDSPIYSIAVSGGEPREIVRGSNDSPIPTPDGKTLVFARSSVRFPTELFTISTAVAAAPPPLRLPATRHSKAQAKAPRAVYSEKDDAVASSSAARQLTHLNDAVLAQIQMQPIEWFWFTGAEKKQVQGFLLKPPDFDPSRKYPVKFLIHGGPQGAWGDDWSFRWNPNLFAASGYVVVMINPRGSTGYGQQFIDDINGDWGGRPFDDLMLGLDYAENKYGFIDRDRECALGASYGGYMANWILGHSDRFKCIVSHDGMFNPESAYGTTEELWFNEWEFKGTPWSNRDALSPLVARPGRAQLQNSNPRHPRPARLPPRCQRRLPALHHPAASQRSQPHALLPRRGTLGAQAAELSALVQDRQRMGRLVHRNSRQASLQRPARFGLATATTINKTGTPSRVPVVDPGNPC